MEELFRKLVDLGYASKLAEDGQYTLSHHIIGYYQDNGKLNGCILVIETDKIFLDKWYKKDTIIKDVWCYKGGASGC